MFYHDSSSSDSLSLDLKVFADESSEFSDFGSERRIPTKVRITILDDDDFSIDPELTNRKAQPGIIEDDKVDNSFTVQHEYMPVNNVAVVFEAENIRRSSAVTSETVHCNDVPQLASDDFVDDIGYGRDSAGNAAEVTSSNFVGNTIDNIIGNTTDNATNNNTGLTEERSEDAEVPSTNERTKDSLFATPPPQNNVSFSKLMTTTPGSPIAHYYKLNKLSTVETTILHDENLKKSSFAPLDNHSNSRDRTTSHNRNLSYSTIEQSVYPKTFSPDLVEDFLFGNSSNPLIENDNSQFFRLQQEKKLKRKQQRFSLNSPISPGFSKMLNSSRNLSKENYESALNDILNFEIIESPANTLSSHSDTLILQNESLLNNRLQNTGSFSKFKSKLTKKFSSSSNDISKFNFPKDDLGIVTNSAY